MPRLSSSNLAGCEYDYDERALTIDFHSGHSYRYSSVPEAVYEGLLRAGSPGQYFIQHIKGRYLYEET